MTPKQVDPVEVAPLGVVQVEGVVAEKVVEVEMWVLAKASGF